MILVPFNSFEWSARTLSKEDLETNMTAIYSVMRALLWGFDHPNTPSVYAWRGSERALLAYQQISCALYINEWGGDDEYWEITRRAFLDIVVDPMATPLIPPRWMGYVDMHISHQSWLLRKNPEYYRDKFPGISPNHDIVWPL